MLHGVMEDKFNPEERYSIVCYSDSIEIIIMCIVLVVQVLGIINLSERLSLAKFLLTLIINMTRTL